MYNLLVAEQKEAWDFPPYRLFNVSRFLASTDAKIVSQFRNIADPEVQSALCSLPTLFMYERKTGISGWVGRITSVIFNDNELSILFEIDRSRTVTWDALTPFYYSLGISDPNELESTHWAVKDRDLDAVMNKAIPLSDRYVSSFPSEKNLIFAPHVFKIPDAKLEQDLVAVMMPFSGFKGTYDAIKEACKISGHRCIRVDDIWVDSTIIQDVFSLIVRANIVVVDFTGKNANVMYETGIAHTLGKHVVPITQASADVPFDLHHHRYLSYFPNGEGLAKMTQELATRLKQLGGGITR